MVNRTLISSKLAELADRAARVRQHRTASATELHLAATAGVDDLEAFARAVAAWAIK